MPYVMVIYQEKCNYMVISRSSEPFSTILQINGTPLERKDQIVHLGMWLTDSLCWERHVSKIYKSQEGILKGEDAVKT